MNAQGWFGGGGNDDDYFDDDDSEAEIEVNKSEEMPEVLKGNFEKKKPDNSLSADDVSASYGENPSGSQRRFGSLKDSERAHFRSAENTSGMVGGQSLFTKSQNSASKASNDQREAENSRRPGEDENTEDENDNTERRSEEAFGVEPLDFDAESDIGSVTTTHHVDLTAFKQASVDQSKGVHQFKLKGVGENKGDDSAIKRAVPVDGRTGGRLPNISSSRQLPDDKSPDTSDISGAKTVRDPGKFLLSERKPVEESQTSREEASTPRVKNKLPSIGGFMKNQIETSRQTSRSASRKNSITQKEEARNEVREIANPYRMTTDAKEDPDSDEEIDPTDLIANPFVNNQMEVKTNSDGKSGELSGKSSAHSSNRGNTFNAEHFRSAGGATSSGSSKKTSIKSDLQSNQLQTQKTESVVRSSSTLSSEFHKISTPSSKGTKNDDPRVNAYVMETTTKQQSDFNARSKQTTAKLSSDDFDDDDEEEEIMDSGDIEESIPTRGSVGGHTGHALPKLQATEKRTLGALNTEMRGSELKGSNFKVVAAYEKHMKPGAGGTMNKQPRFNDDDIRKAFGAFDLDSNGYIGSSEIHFMMDAIGEKVTDEEVDEMIRMLDDDGDGQVTFPEFAKMARGESLAPLGMALPPPNHMKQGGGNMLQRIDTKRSDVNLGGGKLFTTDFDKKAIGSPGGDKSNPKTKVGKSSYSSSSSGDEITTSAAKKAPVIDAAALKTLNPAEKKNYTNDLVSKQQLTSGAVKKTYGVFRSMHLHDERIEVETFLRLFKLEKKRRDPVVARFVTAYDDKNNDTLDPKEVFISINNLTSASKEEKLTFAFTVYDEEQNGFITHQEFFHILKANLYTTNLDNASKKGTLLLNKIKHPEDDDDSLSFEDFMELARKFSSTLLPDV